MKKYRYRLEGLDCAKCASEIEEALSKDQRLHQVVVNFSTLQLSFESDENRIEEVKKIIKATEPEVNVYDISEPLIDDKKMFSRNLIRLIIGILLTVTGYFLKLSSEITTFIYIIAYVVLLYKTFLTACTLLWKRKTINESFLIVLSTMGAFLIGEQLEGLMVIILYEIGKILEERAIHSTRKSIKELMDIKAEYANKMDGEEVRKVSPEELKVGDRFLVKVGEKIPVDGKILVGTSSLDISSLTGESRLRKVSVGDFTLSGSINMESILEIEATKEYVDSTVSKVLELVENATDKKANTETFVNKAAKIYTPIVIFIGIAIAIFLPFIWNIPVHQSIYRALTFLVISCPCAIAISVPLSYFSGIGACSKEGILVKGSNYLDALKDVSTIVFDKTGTLTTGKFTIGKVVSLNKKYQAEDIIQFASLGEQYSNHPIADSILKEGKLDKSVTVSDYEEIAGKGISFCAFGSSFLVGNKELVQCEEKQEEDTILYVQKDKEIIGTISLVDEIKDQTEKGIQKLKEKNIELYMYTGDTDSVASRVAKRLSIDHVCSEMLPTDKYKELQKLLENKRGIVSFVGDGINDAPVLALSDIGISMGGVGSASAIEASDVVIMNDDINKINEGIKIAKYTDRIIRQNLLFAFTVKIVVLSLSAIGIATMWQAVFADVGVTLITILNTLRILRKK